uniref:(northern house mosquito) hypothetical protein n=1 Tax=Culex pipiens TaxID=7175 RepID=A0A8D8DS95_CULPI
MPSRTRTKRTICHRDGKSTKTMAARTTGTSNREQSNGSHRCGPKNHRRRKSLLKRTQRRRWRRRHAAYRTRCSRKRWSTCTARPSPSPAQRPRAAVGCTKVSHPSHEAAPARRWTRRTNAEGGRKLH